MVDLARRSLPWLVAGALIASWWLSLMILLDTPLMDFTPPKIVVLVGGATLLAARPWRGLQLRDWLVMVPVGAYLAWFPLAALLRGTTEDLKTAAAYLVFCGLAAVIAFAAFHLAPRRAARILVIVVLGAVVVSFFAAALERATYPLPEQSDSLAWLWSIFRPQTGLDDPRLGPIPAPPLHAPTGEPGVVRATGFFVQTNYLAFFAVLAVPLLVVLLVLAVRQRRRLGALLAALALVAALTSAYWTYARVGIVAVIAVALAALLAEWSAASERPTLRPSLAQLRPTLLGLVVVVTVMAGLFLVDGVGLNRLIGTGLGDTPPAGTTSPGESPDAVAESTWRAESPEAVAGSAARSATIRLELQRTAVDMLVEDPRALLLGPGLAAYETAVHDPASPRRIPDAFAIRDPNSMWLTVALAGGLIGVLLAATVLGYLMLRLVREVLRSRDGWPRVTVVWMAAWLPVWALVQFLGTNPFNTSEAIIFGTLVGTIAGLTERRRVSTQHEASRQTHQAEFDTSPMLAQDNLAGRPDGEV
jgi:hypothetical protein